MSRPNLRRRTAGLVVALAAGAGGLLAMTAPAAANPAGASVVVTSEAGDGAIAPEGATTLELSGSGFQVIDGGFGGIYAMFGVVIGEAWQPSAGGAFGDNYRYVQDEQTADNAGYQLFLPFPGSSTEESANGGVLGLDGTWSAELVVPGPVIETLDAAGDVVEVDCREETCGVITIGAHGVVNPTNETFTPVVVAQEPEPAATTTSEAAAPSAEPADVASSESAEAAPEAGASDGATESVDAAEASEAADVAGESEAAQASGLPAWSWAVAGTAVVIAAVVIVAAVRRSRASRGTAGEDLGNQGPTA